MGRRRDPLRQLHFGRQHWPDPRNGRRGGRRLWRTGDHRRHRHLQHWRHHRLQRHCRRLWRLGGDRHGRQRRDHQRVQHQLWRLRLGGRPGGHHRLGDCHLQHRSHQRRDRRVRRSLGRLWPQYRGCDERQRGKRDRHRDRRRRRLRRLQRHHHYGRLRQSGQFRNPRGHQRVRLRFWRLRQRICGCEQQRQRRHQRRQRLWIDRRRFGQDRCHRHE